MKATVKTLFNKKTASAEIEAEIGRLRQKLADNETRRSAALQALTVAQDARRAVLDQDEDVVAPATEKVRKARLLVDDMTDLVEQYETAVANAEARLEAALAAEKKQAIIDVLVKAAADVEAMAPELQKAVATLMKLLSSVRSAIPEEFGVFPCHYSHRPEDRPEGNAGMLSPREIVNALLAEVIFGADPAAFDRYRGRFEQGLGLMKLVNPTAVSPAYVDGYARAEPLNTAKALDALIVSRLRARAKSIEDGEIEPILSKIVEVQKNVPAPQPDDEITAEVARVIG